MVLGVFIAVVLPPLSAYIKQQFQPKAAVIDLKKYVALFAFCSIVGLLVLAFFRQAQPDNEITYFAALLAGYTWESTVEKVVTS